MTRRSLDPIPHGRDTYAGHGDPPEPPDEWGNEPGHSTRDTAADRRRRIDADHARRARSLLAGLNQARTAPITDRMMRVTGDTDPDEYRARWIADVERQITAADPAIRAHIDTLRSDPAAA